ncbi:MAG: hypothetical protein CL609_15030 [Anaerolineaceae bacterium]|nr:hypothetical protein [Anaerolineaceae bacterium]
MNQDLKNQVLGAFRLTDNQKMAVLEREKDVVVTAGAGSGKTSTLVARFVTLLADGYPLRSVVAITFTEKAAREMRSRVRQTLANLANQSTSKVDRQKWENLNAEMDSARIATIHSFCSEILREHPAEAGIDPKFNILDEGLAAALKQQIVEETMIKLVKLNKFLPLFQMLKIADLSRLLTFLLNKRLEVQESFEKKIDIDQVIQSSFEAMLFDKEIVNIIDNLRSMGTLELKKDAGDKLAEQIKLLLVVWGKAETAHAAGDIIGCSSYLYQARRESMGLRAGYKTSIAKEMLRELQKLYDEIIDPICGGKDSKEPPPSNETETNSIVFLQLIKPVFEMLYNDYKDNLNKNGYLDFDDLEKGASEIIKQPEIKKRWQNEIQALLVDEFQDTNERQRQIVEALSGKKGRLFVVGDLKQSIYRFRRADVTVFRNIRDKVKAQGGLVIDLDETFRAHKSVINGMGDLLKDIMGEKDIPSQPFYVSYQALISNRNDPRKGISKPFIEFVFGAGDKAKDSRPEAAAALATRLIELKREGQIKSWDDVTLLFRASTGFPFYENAFEEANIPFVTVSGRGFYDRPEIRDILNILRALTDLTDDLTMSGLLRSPAFGLTDAALYHLRWQNETALHFWDILNGDLSGLDDVNQKRAKRALSIIKKLLPSVDKIPIAELLKKIVDETDYRTILAIGDTNGNGGRLWRNLDKLILDAHQSGKVNVRDFLDYLVTLNDVGAREGEASAESLGSVRLMTIHKSKGLQFPIVVLADTNREPRGGGALAYLLPQFGLTCKLDPEPLMFRFAKKQDKIETEAETLRVLYVGLTRTQEKLIISGFTTPNSKALWNTNAWLTELCDSAQIDLNSLVNKSGEADFYQTTTGETIRAWVNIPKNRVISTDTSGLINHITNQDEMPIYGSLLIDEKETSPEDEVRELRSWRATGSVSEIPPTVIGNMVHKAIELWCFPDNPRLITLLETTAKNAGLAQLSQITFATNRAIELLTRFHAHPIKNEIEAASQRYHELPYSRMDGKNVENGYIDLLYRSPRGWEIIDFKTDSIQNTTQQSELISQYAKQARKYTSVVTGFLGEKVVTKLCFLDAHGKLDIIEINS